jgi:hypothetical protein
MRRISSGLTFYYKRVFPVIWFGGAAVIAGFGAYAAIANPSAKGFGPFWIVMPIILFLGYRFLKKFVFDLVDEVWDDGDSLLVKNQGQEERIPLGDIKNVNYASTMNPPRVVLSVRRKTLLGEQIAFCAPVYLVPFSSSPVINKLIERVAAAREKQR